MQKTKSQRNHYLIIALILLFYFAITLFRLNQLPVFADEAIYIRWTQLIIDDWQRYLFFPMNDGKTPLQMWLMIPFQFIFKNQLFAGRFLSVLVGAGNVVLIGLISKEMTAGDRQKKFSQYIAMILTSILPFTFFHHRMALTDALLFLNLNCSFYFTLKYIKQPKITDLLLLILSFFLALFSKLSALLFIPSLIVLILYANKLSWKSLLKNLIYIGAALAVAFLLFYSWRFLPVFPQLFRRGSDFLYPVETLFHQEIFNIFLGNLNFFINQYAIYFGPGILILAIANFNKKNKKLLGLLVLMFLAFITPLALLGKIIYPRYLLPSSLFIILIASINLANLLSAKEKIYHILAGILIFLIVLHSGKFIFPSYFNIEQIPFSQADRVQYLEEWSSGQGIYDVSQLMLHTSQNQSLAVATEGFFGTLPDGILMYLHRQNVNNLLVEGIGQPIHAIPDDFLTKAKNYESLWLVVNSHRITMDTSHAQLIATYCRPNRAPCLQVWDMSYLLENN
ncbi:MAG TPA: glycosyltransferase family 39 protein [Candidatus Woesebacteria bacterium]|nr:glycosyltransferase family 39 protein [Candidatus Woesebacteria bacterium]